MRRFAADSDLPQQIDKMKEWRRRNAPNEKWSKAPTLISFNLCVFISDSVFIFHADFSRRFIAKRKSFDLRFAGGTECNKSEPILYE